MKTTLCGPIKLSISKKVWVALIGNKITGIFIGKKPKVLNIERTGTNAKITSALAKHLEQLMKGQRASEFTISIERGTGFQKRVWEEISKIPFGKTKSYSDIAEKIGRQRSVRAVANACGANPVPLIIPCHRVIAKDGTIGGFSCGVEVKRALLKLEGNIF